MIDQWTQNEPAELQAEFISLSEQLGFVLEDMRKAYDEATAGDIQAFSGQPLFPNVDDPDMDADDNLQDLYAEYCSMVAASAASRAQIALVQIDLLGKLDSYLGAPHEQIAQDVSETEKTARHLTQIADKLFASTSGLDCAIYDMAESQCDEEGRIASREKVFYDIDKAIHAYAMQSLHALHVRMEFAQTLINQLFIDPSSKPDFQARNLPDPDDFFNETLEKCPMAIASVTNFIDSRLRANDALRTMPARTVSKLKPDEDYRRSFPLFFFDMN
jgi:hypothetical protein